MRKGEGGAPDAAATEHAATLRGDGGVELPEGLRTRLEASTGADLGGVRLHTGAESAAAAAGVSARAYTVGQDIHFGAGEYAPGTSAGDELIAHEVAHTVQQRSGPTVPQAKAEVSSPGDACEADADAFASAALAGESYSIAVSAGPAVQRAPTQQDTGPRMLKKGKDTMQYVARMLPQAQPLPITSGFYRGMSIVPGSVWGGDRCMVIFPSYEAIYYTIDDVLYSCPSETFTFGQGSMGAFQTAGKNGEGMVRLIQCEYALLAGLFVPWWGMLGLGAAQIAVEYEVHKEALEPALKRLPEVYNKLNELRTRYPKLFWHVVAEILAEVPSSVSAEDAAFLAGRVVASFAGTSGAALGITAEATKLSFKSLAWVLLKCSTILTATHLPAWGGKAAQKAAKGTAKKLAAGEAVKVPDEVVKELMTGLSAEAVNLDEATAREILAEIGADRIGAAATLESAAREVEAVLPLLDALKGH
ncbi:MAG: DUF4157 domain-containing protein [Deltaproteobacteria bacterium]|nr:DUF4157 domain-containing protein [Deltaproteobacteria bacterium]